VVEEDSIEKRIAGKGDFEYVQLDSSIHDQKFKTKPTTYFKDALKRFAKNKSSLVATGIMAILVLTAICVPIFDHNNIDKPVISSKFLPPKWWGVNSTGFMDGTGEVANIVIDPETNLPASSTAYNPYSIIGDINYHDETYNLLSDTVKAYGHGGDVLFRCDKADQNGGFESPNFTVDMTKTYGGSITFDEEAIANNGNNPVYSVLLVTDFTSENANVSKTEVVLNEASSSYASPTIADLVPAVKNNAAYIAAGSPASFSATLALSIKTVSEGAFPALYLKAVDFHSGDGAVAPVNFSDATRMLASTDRWTVYGSSTYDVYQAIITEGDFRYDYYDAAYGFDSFAFTYIASGTGGDVNTFIKNGWMEKYDFSSFTEEGHLYTDCPNIVLTEAGETYCPLRPYDADNPRTTKVTIKRNTIGKAISYTITGTRSLYRYGYYKGQLAKCAVPMFFFGTNDQGVDFFKVVMSGLLTSLELGFLAAAINISVGLIWGSFSGYFGGWVDLLMERVTEILGGMPWIVLMTLIVLLLGSSFWTFLLALCLTGWTGIAGETREQFYRYKGREYVLASRTLGASDSRLIFRHILPNGIGTIITGAVLMIPGVIFSEATISYLLPGALAFSGAQSFGVTLSNAQGYLGTHPYLIVSASLIMAFIMISFNLFGNGLRDAFNPSLKGEEQ
jgi:oligopeptide transport system permease protein